MVLYTTVRSARSNSPDHKGKPVPSKSAFLILFLLIPSKVSRVVCSGHVTESYAPRFCLVLFTQCVFKVHPHCGIHPYSVLFSWLNNILFMDVPQCVSVFTSLAFELSCCF